MNPFTESPSRTISKTCLYLAMLVAAPSWQGCNPGDEHNESVRSTPRQIPATVPPAQPNARPSPADSLQGITKAIFDAYQRGERENRINNEPINYLFLSSDGKGIIGFGTLASMVHNQIGRDLNVARFSKNYMVVDEIGGVSSVAPGKVAEQLPALRDIFVGGGTIQLIGFSDNYVPGGKNCKVLHVGASIADTYLEERLGRADAEIPGFPGWQRAYVGRDISRIYKFNPTTGFEAEQVAWTVDLFYKADLAYRGKEHNTLLKKIVSIGYSRFPEYVAVEKFCAAPGTVIVDEWKNRETKRFVLLPAQAGWSDDLKKYFHFFYSRMDDLGRPISNERLWKFDNPLQVSEVNALGRPPPTIGY